MIPAREFRLRLKKLRQHMSDEGLRLFLVTNSKDLKYLTGHPTGQAVIGCDFATLYVKDVFHKIYEATYNQRRYPLNVVDVKKGCVRAELGKTRCRKIGFSEHEFETFLGKKCRKKPKHSDAVGYARTIKTDYEVTRMKKSGVMASKAMDYAQTRVGEGVVELDAVADIQAVLYRLGSQDPAFEAGLLLASGDHSADIHAKARHYKMRRGPVVVDLGAVYEGYHSDMTRTFELPRMPPDCKAHMEDIKRIKDDAVDAIKPGVLAGEIHRKVEDDIKRLGFEFYHSAGHGLGLNIHEYPYFRSEKKWRLKEGMVITCEPGIYLPKKYGIRYEDTYLVTKKGAKKLT